MKLLFKSIITATLATALLSGRALMADKSSAKVADGMLVSPSGMTLYVFLTATPPGAASPSSTGPAPLTGRL